MSDWWSRHLGGGPQRTPSQGPVQTSPATPGGPYPPPGYPNPPNPWEAPQAPQSRGQVTMHNLVEMMAQWRGGEGQRNSTVCPHCGSDKLYRRKVGQMEAAPLCYSCGFNGLWDQAQPGNYV